MFSSDFQPWFEGNLEPKSIGKKVDLVKNQVAKWIYRQGNGACPQTGDLISCIVGAWLLDGTQIIVPNKQNVVKYVFGRGRLIEGLEMAFQKCKKGEVFQVKVSPEYAYDDREDIPSIPPNSSIVFDVTVLDIQKPDPQNQTLTEQSYELMHLLQKADDEFRKQNFHKAIEILRQAHNLGLKLSPYKSPLPQKIVVKMANIFIFNKKHDEALKILKEYEKFEEHNFLLSKCKLKIYEMNGQLDKLMDEMKAKYQKHRRNENATKLIEEYFKKMGKQDFLKGFQKLENQDQDDKQFQGRRSEPYVMPGMRGYSMQ